LLIVAASLGAWYYLGQQDLKASAELNQAVRTMQTPLLPPGTPAQPDFPSFASEKERATAAQKQLQGIVDRYPQTHSGEVARYFLGVMASRLGDNAGAERQLRVVSEYHSDDLAALANFTLASIYRSTNRGKEAVDIYKKLIEKPTDTVSKA